MNTEKKIYLPTVKHKPLILIGFEPQNAMSRHDIDSIIISSLSSVFDATTVSKQIFDRETHFRLDERLIYIPNLEHTRQFIKCKIDAKWAHEKAELQIDPTYFIADILLHDKKFYIKLSLNELVSHSAAVLAEFITNLLSKHGRCFILVHKRTNSLDRHNDVEIFKEVVLGRISNVLMKFMPSQPSVFDTVYEQYNISIQAIVTAMDHGIELQCAPYDLEEYRNKIKMYEENTIEKDIVLDEEPDENNELSTITSENNQEYLELKALIQATEKLLQNATCNVDTIYFKMSQNRYKEIKELGKN